MFSNRKSLWDYVKWDGGGDWGSLTVSASPVTVTVPNTNQTNGCIVILYAGNSTIGTSTTRTAFDYVSIRTYWQNIANSTLHPITTWFSAQTLYRAGSIFTGNMEQGNLVTGSNFLCKETSHRSVTNVRFIPVPSGYNLRVRRDASLCDAVDLIYRVIPLPSEFALRYFYTAPSSFTEGTILNSPTVTNGLSLPVWDSNENGEIPTPLPEGKYMLFSANSYNLQASTTKITTFTLTQVGHPINPEISTFVASRTTAAQTGVVTQYTYNELVNLFPISRIVITPVSEVDLNHYSSVLHWANWQDNYLI